MGSPSWGWFGSAADETAAAEQTFVSVARVESGSKHAFALDIERMFVARWASWVERAFDRPTRRPSEERAFVERPF
jgi:hypothetical protein